MPNGKLVADVTEIFVFGSNLAGRHGKGAALYARKHHGAVYGKGLGRMGAHMQSRRRTRTGSRCRWIASASMLTSFLSTLRRTLT
jgi:hypothetical protein